MFNSDIYVARRAELCRRVGKGLILLPQESMMVITLTMCLI